MKVTPGKLLACLLTPILFFLSVKVTVNRLADINEVARSRRERIRDDNLSDRVHSLYSDEIMNSSTYSNETLGASAFHLIDVRNQSTNATRSFSLDMVQQMSDDCNCLVDTNGRGPCCVRYYRRPHKMGNIQSLSLLPDGVRDLIRITSSEFLTHSPPYDYRDVVLVRDLYDAVISGYLYQ